MIGWFSTAWGEAVSATGWALAGRPVPATFTTIPSSPRMAGRRSGRASARQDATPWRRRRSQGWSQETAIVQAEEHTRAVVGPASSCDCASFAAATWPVVVVHSGTGPLLFDRRPPVAASNAGLAWAQAGGDGSIGSLWQRWRRSTSPGENAAAVDGRRAASWRPGATWRPFQGGMEYLALRLRLWLLVGLSPRGWARELPHSHSSTLRGFS